MGTKEEQLGKLEEQLKQLGAKLDDLATKAQTVGADAKSDERDFVADLRTKREFVQTQLDGARDAGEDQWETIKAGVEGAYGEHEDAFNQLAH